MRSRRSNTGGDWLPDSSLALAAVARVPAMTSICSDRGAFIVFLELSHVFDAVFRFVRAATWVVGEELRGKFRVVVIASAAEVILISRSELRLSLPGKETAKTVLTWTQPETRRG